MNCIASVSWEHSGNIQGTFREQSGNIQGTFAYRNYIRKRLPGARLRATQHVPPAQRVWNGRALDCCHVHKLALPKGVLR
jgi:hypothetical protein